MAMMISALGKHIQKHTCAPNIHANTYTHKTHTPNILAHIHTHTHTLTHTQHARERGRTNTYTHTHIYIAIRLYLYIV